VNFTAHSNKCERKKNLEKREREMDEIHDDDEVAPASASASASAYFAHAHDDDFDAADTAAPLRTSAAAKISAKSKSKSRSRTETETENRNEKKCPVCNRRCPAQIFRAHVSKCEAEKMAEESKRKRMEKARADLATWEDPDDDDDDDEDEDDDDKAASASASDDDTEGGDATLSALGYDMVRIVKRSPSSLTYPAIPHIFEAYRAGVTPAHRPASHPRPPRHSDSDDTWWEQFFESREEFLLAEILLEIDMNEEQTDRLMEIIGRCAAGGEGTCTFESYADVKAAWDRAGMIGPGVRVYERTDADWFGEGVEPF